MLASLAVGCVFATAPGAAAEAATPAAQRTARAQVSLTSLDPMVVMPSAQVSLAGYVRNNGGLRLSTVQVRLRVSGRRLTSRAELAAAAAGRSSGPQGEIVARQRLSRRLDVGRQARFQLSADLTEGSRERAFGVYGLTIEVVAASRDGFGRVGVTRTFLPWIPARRDFKPGGFSWLWPVVGAPTRRADGSFADDTLNQEMAATGRLGRIVSAGESLSARLPLTWVIEPTLLEDADDMSRGYRVVAGQAGMADGAGAAYADDWLGRLQVAIAGRPLISLPYGDPDLVALRRHGLLDDVAAARARGADTTSRLLGQRAATDIAWPADGFADRATVSALRGVGYTAVLLDARAVPPEQPLTYTPSGRADIRTPNGTSAGLLYDPVLTRILGARDTASPVLTAQRFLAETAMITAELPSVGTDRKILVAPPRRWSPSPQTLTRLVDVVARAPWFAGVPTQTLVSTKPPRVERKPLRYPASIRKRELPGPYLGGVRAMNESIDVFASVLTTRPNPLIQRLKASVYRLESTWWRGREQRVNRLVDERRELTAQRKQVRVLPGNYTFGSRTGTIPLTISNGLNQEVVVDVQLTPKSLLIEIGDVKQQRIAPESKVQVSVPAKARAKGVVLVETSLQTPSGLRYDNPVQLRVRVTRYGTVALYITLGAAAVLMLASMVRLVRRGSRRRRRRRDSKHGAPEVPSRASATSAT